MLFKDLEEIKKYVNSAESVDFNQLKSSIEDAERMFIIPIISQAQYDDLNDKYTVAGNAGLETKEKKLLEKIQNPLARFAYMLWMPEGMIKVTGDGFQIVSDDKMKTAWQWQTDKLEFKMMTAGYAGIDSLLEFLESNKADYPLWTASSAFTIFKECFINTAKDFSSRHNIGDSRRVFLKIRDLMKTVEDFYIVPNIGQAYFDALKTSIAEDNVSTDDKKTLEFIQKAVAKLTISKALQERVVDINNNGIYINVFHDGINERSAPGTGRGSINGIDVRLDNSIRSTTVDGQTYLKQLRTFLNANAASDKYALYYNSGPYVAPGTVNKLKNSQASRIYKA